MNVEKIRKDFTVLDDGKITYFDNACMTLKPRQVVDKINQYYNEFPGCAGRSAHKFSVAVDHEVGVARDSIRKLVNARKKENCIFTRNTTEAINLVANSYGQGDEVIITDKEHNSNLIPWHKQKVDLKVCHSLNDNTFDMEAFKDLLSKNTKLVSVVMTSNLDGVSNPVKEITKMAHEVGAKVLLDGAQGVPCYDVNVKKLDCDFLAFSGHKLMGPTGTGVLYGKAEALEELNEFMVGGSTVVDSTYDGYTADKIPMRFEAGLQDYANIMGLGEAARYLMKIGPASVHKHEVKLNKLLTESLVDDKLSLIGPMDASLRSGVFSFNINGMPLHEVAGILNSSNIMVRSGAHCVHSWFNKHKSPGSVRASLYAYNTVEEVEGFVSKIEDIKKLV